MGFSWLEEKTRRNRRGSRQNCPFCRVSAKIFTRTPPHNFFLYLATVVSGLKEKRKNETEGGGGRQNSYFPKIDVFEKEGDQTYLETPEAEISAAGTWGRLKSPQLNKSRLNQKTMNAIKTNYIPSNQAQNACSWWVARSRRVSLKVAAWSLKVAARSLKVAAPPKQKRNGQKQEKTLMWTIFCLSLKGLQTYKLKWQPQKSPPTNQSRLTNYEAEILAARSF